MKNLIIFIVSLSILVLVGCDTGKKYDVKERTIYHIYVEREIGGDTNPMVWISAHDYNIEEDSVGRVSSINVSCPCYVGNKNPKLGVGLRLLNNPTQDGGNKISFKLLGDAPYYIKIEEPNGQLKIIRTN